MNIGDHLHLGWFLREERSCLNEPEGLSRYIGRLAEININDVIHTFRLLCQSWKAHVGTCSRSDSKEWTGPIWRGQRALLEGEGGPDFLKLKPRNSRVSRVPPEATLPNVSVTMCAGLRCKWLAEDDVSQLVTNPAKPRLYDTRQVKEATIHASSNTISTASQFYVHNLWIARRLIH